MEAVKVRPQQKTILVVDDNLNNLRLLCSILSEQGFRVRPARSGSLAIESARIDPPHLILLDINMPHLNGYEVCRALKEDPETTDIPIIFVSAYNHAANKVKGFDYGGVDYITKPFQAEEVLARVHTHLVLRELQRDLETRNQDLEAFGYTVAHDLKNPLHFIKGISNLMLDDLPADTQMHEDIEGIHNAAISMENITNSLFVLATIRRRDLHLVPLNMQEILDQSIAQVSHFIRQREAVVVRPDAWPRAQGIGSWVEQIWINYLTNALKYGGKPPRIMIGADVVGDGMIRFWIKDNGKGIPENQVSRIFEEFTRVGKQRTDSHGLGLAVVKRIISKLGGTVGAASQLGQGSTFHFTLRAAED